MKAHAVVLIMVALLHHRTAIIGTFCLASAHHLFYH